jgi:hypothetical protein
MLVLSGFGFWHLRRVDPAAELMPERRSAVTASPAVA